MLHPIKHILLFKLKLSIFFYTTLIHFFITSLLFQAFLCQNANNYLLSTRGYFSCSFEILPFSFLNTKKDDNFVQSATIYIITVTRYFLSREFKYLQFLIYFCNCLSSCHFQEQGCLICL